MIREITTEHRRHIYCAGSDGLRDIEQEIWDACVIGSGPGGAVTAATLAEAGWRVLLVERGPFRPPAELNFRVLDMASRLGHAELTSGARSALLQGNGLGGSSLVFGAVAMKPPHFIFDEWQRASGAAHFDDEVLAPHYAHVGDVLSVTRQSPSKETRSNAIVREMATALGCPEGLELVHRYTRGCAGMGLCNLGCGLNLKGTMTNSFLPIALDTGRLTVLTECEALAFEGSSTSMEFCASSLATAMRDFETGRVVSRPRVRARVFVLAAGAFFSSALLMRTRALARGRAGRKIWLQPHAQIFALFDSKVTARGVMDGDRYLPYNGVPAIYNFTGMLRERRYFWLASTLFPASLATWTSHLPPDEHLALMRRFHYVSSVTITIRDDPERASVVMRDRPQLEFHESRQDMESVRHCFRDAARAFLAVGARRVLLPMLDPPRIEREADLRALDRLNMSYDRLLLYSDHTSGGLSCGSDASRGATDVDGRLFGTANVYVADSSVFPSACGVNPSWTIMALSHRMAWRLGASSPPHRREPVGGWAAAAAFPGIRALSTSRLAGTMMSRRRFIQQTGAAASAAFAFPVLQPRRRYKLGLQLFTMRAPLKADVEGTLKRVAAMGYEEFETYGFDPEGIGYYGRPAKAFAQLLRDLNLTAPSGHYDLNRFMSTSVDDLTRDVDRCIEGAHALGQSYITWPLLDQNDRTIERFKVAAERLNAAGARIKKAGLQLAYHNHDFEFVDQNGQIGYDVITKETDPALVKLQVDLYWMARASQVPNEWFRRQPGRFVMWHVKDMHRTSRDYTEVGNGTIDFTRIWPDAELAGLKHFFVEQGGNFTHDPFRSVADSAEYVKRVLLK